MPDIESHRKLFDGISILPTDLMSNCPPVCTMYLQLASIIDAYIRDHKLLMTVELGAANRKSITKVCFLHNYCKKQSVDDSGHDRAGRNFVRLPKHEEITQRNINTSKFYMRVNGKSLESIAVQPIHFKFQTTKGQKVQTWPMRMCSPHATTFAIML